MPPLQLQLRTPHLYSRARVRILASDAWHGDCNFFAFDQARAPDPIAMSAPMVNSHHAGAQNVGSETGSLLKKTKVYPDRSVIVPGLYRESRGARAGLERRKRQGLAAMALGAPRWAYPLLDGAGVCPAGGMCMYVCHDCTGYRRVDADRRAGRVWNSCASNTRVPQRCMSARAHRCLRCPGPQRYQYT